MKKSIQRNGCQGNTCVMNAKVSEKAVENAMKKDAGGTHNRK